MEGIDARSTGIFSVKHFRLIQLVITVGLILSIAGGVNSNGIKIPTTSKVGIILYIIAFVAIVLICLFSLGGLTYAPTAERRICFGVLVALPFIAVQIIYSVLAVFLHNHLFNIFNGSVAVLVAMSVVEEFIIIFIYLLLGWTLPKIEAAKMGGIDNRPWQASSGRGQEQQGLPQYQMPTSQGSTLPQYPMPFNQAHIPPQNV
jgi:hypothetical protein